MKKSVGQLKLPTDFDFLGNNGDYCRGPKKIKRVILSGYPYFFTFHYSLFTFTYSPPPRCQFSPSAKATNLRSWIAKRTLPRCHLERSASAVETRPKGGRTRSVRISRDCLLWVFIILSYHYKLQTNLSSGRYPEEEFLIARSADEQRSTARSSFFIERPERL